MLVKIKPGVYVNTDHVISVVFYNSGQARVDTAGPGGAAVEPWTVFAEGAAYLMQQMDVASAVILPGEPDYIDQDAPSSQPLTSQIAILLRDTFPHGASLDQLMDTFQVDAHSIHSALFSLAGERVAIIDNDTQLVFHASHAPKEYATEPEREIDLLDAAPFTAAIRNGEFQCLKCKHQSCAVCVTANGCCQCNYPNFTLRVALPTKNCKPKTENCVTPTLDLSTEGEASGLHPEEDSEKIEVQTIENLCDLCGSLLTSQTHLNNCVPLGVLE